MQRARHGRTAPRWTTCARATATLGIWIEDSRGRQVYGGEPPVILERLAGNEVELHAPDGSRMRGFARGAGRAPGARRRPHRGVGAARGCSAYGTRAAADLRALGRRHRDAGGLGRARSMAPARRPEQAARIQPDNLAPRLPLQDTDRELRFRAFLQPHAGPPAIGLPADGRLQRRRGARAAHAAGHPDQRHPGHAVSPRDAAELRDALESNLEVLEDLKTMVNDMLFLARADRGERAADLSAISLAAEARRGRVLTPRWKSAASACAAKATRPSRPIPVWCAARWPT